MTAETENLALELLRGMRSDMDKRFSGIETRLAGIEERIEAIETQLEGIRYVIVASVGSRVTDVKDHDARVARLEGISA